VRVRKDGPPDEARDEHGRWTSGGAASVNKVNEEFRVAGPEVDGRTVRDEISNEGSIGASLYSYETLEGIREVPFSAFEDLPELAYRSPQERDRTRGLAREIQESGEIEPLIVVVDHRGPYVLEGGHRFDALRELGAKSFPALIVVDTEVRGTVEKYDPGQPRDDQGQWVVGGSGTGWVGPEGAKNPPLSVSLRTRLAGSKVIDASGNPVRVYHGSTKHFTAFDEKASRTDSPVLGRGFYFSDDPGEADRYAGERGMIVPAYLDIRHPLELDKPVLQEDIEAVRRVVEERLRVDLPAHLRTWFPEKPPSPAELIRAVDKTLEIKMQSFKEIESGHQLPAAINIAFGGMGTKIDANKVLALAGFDGIHDPNLTKSWVAFKVSQIHGAFEKRAVWKSSPDRATAKAALARRQTLLVHRAADAFRDYLAEEREHVVDAVLAGRDPEDAVTVLRPELDEVYRQVWGDSAETHGRWVRGHFTRTVKMRVRRDGPEDDNLDTLGAPIDEWLRVNAGVRITGITETSRRLIAEQVAAGTAAGETIPQIARRLGQFYLDSIIPNRAMVIARTEVSGAMSWASNHAATEAQRDGNVEMEKEWLSNHDDRVRGTKDSDEFDHVEADGQRVPMDEPFVVSGEQLMYPLDGSRGASAGNVINCRCLPAGSMVIADGILAATRRWFEGEIVEVVTATGDTLTATPNHPVLGQAGWVTVGSLREGDDLARCLDADRMLGRHPDVDHGPTAVEEVFDALSLSRGGGRRVQSSGVDFHGDGRDGDVDVVAADDVLTLDAQTEGSKHVGEFRLTPTTSRQVSASDDTTDQGVVPHPEGVRLRPASRRDASVPEDVAHRVPVEVELSRERLFRPTSSVERDEAFGDGSVALLEEVRPVPPGPEVRPGPLEHPVGLHGRYVELLTYLPHAEPGVVGFTKVVAVRRRVFAGYVYNLHTKSGWYIADSIVSHNCDVLYHVLGPAEKRAVKKDGPVDEARDEHGRWTGAGWTKGGDPLPPASGPPLVRVVGADFSPTFLHGTATRNLGNLGAERAGDFARKPGQTGVPGLSSEMNEFRAPLLLSEPRQAHQAVLFSRGRGNTLAVVTLKPGTKVLDLSDEVARTPTWTLGGEPPVLQFFERPAITDDMTAWRAGVMTPGYKERNPDWASNMRMDPAVVGFDIHSWRESLVPYAHARGYGAVRFADETLLVDRGALDGVRRATRAEVSAAATARAFPGSKGASLFTDKPAGAREEAAQSLRPRKDLGGYAARVRRT
jgi:hypothetical protein